MSKHTPTPWMWSGNQLLHNDEANFSSSTVLMIHDDTWAPTDADKALIVHCVNSHDALVAFHDAWVSAEVSQATGNPELVKKLRAELIAAHAVVRAALAAEPQEK